jgi:hypothetical protein
VSGDAHVVSKLVARLAGALASSPDARGELWDLDEIFWNDYPKPWDVGRAIGAFAAAVDCYAPWSEQLVATLQIWLRQSDVLRVEAPALSSVAGLDVNPDHPPAVGVIRKARPVPAYELYRVPVSQQLVDLPDGQVRAYYECFRTVSAQAAGEPYDRIVVLQHWA